MRINSDTSLKVVMHNDLIRSKSELSLNEIKLLRLTIMQIMKGDMDFMTYEIPIVELAKLLNIDNHNLYRDIQDMCIHLLKEVVLIGDGNPRHKWNAFQWVSSCKYNDGMITIRLHDDLKPYLLELKGLYTQYLLEDVLMLKSVYSIRIYELIREAMRGKSYHADNVVSVELSMAMIRKATNTETLYKRYSSFQTYVIDKAMNEINEKLNMHIDYQTVKEQRKIVGFIFTISSKWNPINREE